MRLLNYHGVSPNLVDYTGFNLYRKEEGVDQAFARIIELPRGRRSYTDTTITYGNMYKYFIKVASGNLESRPSEEVSVNPGPGYNWIVDETSYKVVKTSYDLSYTFFYYDTFPGRPTDIAVSNTHKTAVILCTAAGLVQEIDFSGNLIDQHTQIRNPYAVAYDPVGSLFWIVDSSGILYTLNPQNGDIWPENSSLSKPISIHIAAEKNIISIVDAGVKEIVQFNRSGYILNKITRINGKPLEGPYRYIIDEKHDRSWLIDGNMSFDYVYTKTSEDNEYIIA